MDFIAMFTEYQKRETEKQQKLARVTLNASPKPKTSKPVKRVEREPLPSCAEMARLSPYVAQQMADNATKPLWLRHPCNTLESAGAAFNAQPPTLKTSEA
jgi:hypothetical protein